MMILIELKIAHRHMQIISAMRVYIALDLARNIIFRAKYLFFKFCAFKKLFNEINCAKFSALGAS
jgi:hypothetical protein